MAELAVWETVRLAERARVACAFVGGVLSPGHLRGDDAELLVSELFGNSVRYSRSSGPGETIAVAVMVGDGIVRVEVTDRIGPGRRDAVIDVSRGCLPRAAMVQQTGLYPDDSTAYRRTGTMKRPPLFSSVLRSSSTQTREDLYCDDSSELSRISHRGSFYSKNRALSRRSFAVPVSRSMKAAARKTRTIDEQITRAGHISQAR